MDLSPLELKKNNSLLVWSSDKEVKDLIIFLNRNGFYWDEKNNYYYNKEHKISLEQEELLKIIENNELLFIKANEILSKRDRKDNYIVDDVRVAGYFLNAFVFLGIMNLFLGWIFFHLIVWIIIQILLISAFLLFYKMKKKITRKIKNKKYAC